MPMTLRTPAHSELLIKKSRFIGCVEPMADRGLAGFTQRVNDLWQGRVGWADRDG